MGDRNKVLHLLMTEYRVDSRVRNETDSLARAGYDVTVCCLTGRGLSRRESREVVSIVRCGYHFKRSRILTLLSAWCAMFFSVINKNFRCVHAHDITALPIGYAVARCKGIPLIYDSHELWSEAEHGDYPAYLLKVSSWLERKLAQKADAIFTVSGSIAEHIRATFSNCNVEVLRNVPSYVHEGEYDLFRTELGIGKDTPIVLYQGFISVERGVNYIVDAIVRLAEDRNFVMIFLGDGPYSGKLTEAVSEANLEEKVKILGSVSQDLLLQYTSSADIGIHAISNTCLNHEYCLPNKLFEYISGGLAVVVTDLREMTDLVREFSIGLVFKDGDAGDLALQLSVLLDSPESLRLFRENADLARKQLTWTNEEKVLLSAYKRLLSA